jgi:hypothetical protein
MPVIFVSNFNPDAFANVRVGQHGPDEALCRGGD